MVPLSRELVADGVNAAQVNDQTVAQALAIKIDNLAIQGNAVIIGILNAGEVQESASVGAVDYGDLITAVSNIGVSNGPANAYIVHPIIAVI